jgi:hypothetical protein
MLAAAVQVPVVAAVVETAEVEGWAVAAAPGTSRASPAPTMTSRLSCRRPGSLAMIVDLLITPRSAVCRAR